MLFSSKFPQQEVLCVKLYSHFLIAGIGGFCYVFSRETLAEVFKLLLFTGQKIHFFKEKIGENELFAAGGKHLSVITINPACGECCQIFTVNCKDWIMDCLSITRSKFLTITAHNQTQLWKDSTIIATSSTDPFLLYSCCVLKAEDNFVIFSGSAFSHICIWIPDFKSTEVQKISHVLKGHTGVIFSITVSSDLKWISSTSDDRSVRLWKIIFKNSSHWKTASFEPFHVLFGHEARVWRSIFIKSYLISIGEDSHLCIWDLQGNLLAKAVVHRGSGIRAVDFHQNELYTGGEDGGIVVLDLNNLLSTARVEEIGIPQSTPRKIVFVCGELMCLTDKHLLREEKQILQLSNFAFMEKSPCGQFLALGSSSGKILIFDILLNKVTTEKTLTFPLMTMHWRLDFILISNPSGLLTLFSMNSSPLSYQFSFQWHRGSCVNSFLALNEFLIVGDRAGSLRIFDCDGKCLQLLKNLHGNLGVTDIVFNSKDGIFTSGKDGLVHRIAINGYSMVVMQTYRLPIDWAERIVVDFNKVLVLGFSNVFLKVWDVTNREELFSFSCGGGHRSFDYFIKNNTFNLIFIKSKKIFKISGELTKLRKLRDGFHTKEVNCLKPLSLKPLIFLTGSEDTTLRLTHFADFHINDLSVIENHVSSVRCVTVCEMKKEKWIYTAGGRDQLMVYKFCNKELQYFGAKQNKNVNDTGSRYMSLDSLVDDDYDVPIIVAGCSDRTLRIYKNVTLVNKLEYSHCILNVKILKMRKNDFFVISFATNGKAAIWNVTCCVQETAGGRCTKQHLLDEISLHQSGINAVAIRILNESRLLCVTGGDDNKLQMTEIQFGPSNSVSIVNVYKSSNIHSCQITGLVLEEDLLFSTSTDQRLTAMRFDEKVCTIIDQCITTVPDVHGVTLLTRTQNNFLFCVFGKGLEFVTFDLNNV